MFLCFRFICRDDGMCPIAKSFDGVSCKTGWAGCSREGSFGC